MRIIAGSAGSVPIMVPKNLTRPTTDRVRESMFAALGDLVPGAEVLDLFAGSGALGLEALSRGAAGATFVESNAAACEIISANLQKARLDGRVQRQDALAFVSRVLPETYDLVFADPPYARDEETLAQLTALLMNENLPRCLKAGGIFVLESFADSPLPDSAHWSVAREKIYGSTRVSFLASPTRPEH